VLALFMGLFLYRNSEKLLERPFLFFASLMAVLSTMFLVTTYGAPYTPPSYILLGIVCVVTIFISLVYTFPSVPFHSYFENSLRKRKEVFIIVILVVLAILPTHTILTKPGFPESHDLIYHVSNVWVMYRYWREGIIYSPFDPWNGIGGLALFRFYHFLGYYFAFPFSLFLNTFLALKGAIVLSFILCALSVYYMAKKISQNSIVAGISAISFTFIGLHLTTAFYRGTFTELMGYTYVPLIFIFSRESLKKDSNHRFSKAVISGVFLAGLILTHLPTAYSSVFIITVYAIYSLLDEFIARQLTIQRVILIVAVFFIPIGVGLGLTAWWLIPAYTQTPSILWDVEVALSTGNNPALHFVSLPQLYTRELWWRMRGSKIGIAGEMPFYVGIVSLGLAVCSFFLRGNKNSKNNESKFFMALLIISLILADYPSVFIYYYVPLISFFKWPWRFLLPASLSIAYLTGTVINTIYEKAKDFEIRSNFKFRWSHWILVITVLLILVDMWPDTGAYKWEYYPQDEDYLDALQWIKSSDTGLYRISDLYGRGRGESITKTEFYDVQGPQWWTASRSLRDNVNVKPSFTKELGYLSLKYLLVGQKNEAEWLLNGWQKIRFYENSNMSILQNPYFRPMVEIVDDADALFPNSIGTADFLSINPTSLTINAQSSDGGILLVKYGIFPNWKAYLDSTEIIIKENKFGIITLELPAGEHLITLRFEENVPIGYPISILCLVGVVFYLSVVLILPKFKPLISNAKNQKK
jgi:hypothetical protein